MHQMHHRRHPHPLLAPLPGNSSAHFACRVFHHETMLDMCCMTQVANALRRAINTPGNFRFVEGQFSIFCRQCFVLSEGSFERLSNDAIIRKIRKPEGLLDWILFCERSCLPSLIASCDIGRPEQVQIFSTRSLSTQATIKPRKRQSCEALWPHPTCQPFSRN